MSSLNSFTMDRFTLTLKIEIGCGDFVLGPCSVVWFLVSFLV